MDNIQQIFLNFNIIFMLLFNTLTIINFIHYCYKFYLKCYVKISLILFLVGGDFRWSLVLPNQSEGSSERCKHSDSTCMFIAGYILP